MYIHDVMQHGTLLMLAASLKKTRACEPNAGSLLNPYAVSFEVSAMTSGPGKIDWYQDASVHLCCLDHAFVHLCCFDHA